MESLVPVQAVIATFSSIFFVTNASAACTPSGMAVALKVW